MSRKQEGQQAVRHHELRIAPICEGRQRQKTAEAEMLHGGALQDLGKRLGCDPEAKWREVSEWVGYKMGSCLAEAGLLERRVAGR